MAADHEIRDDVLPPCQGSLTGWTAEGSLVAATRTLDLKTAPCCITLPGRSSLKKRVRGEVFDSELEIVDKARDFLLAGEAGGQFRVYYRADNHRPGGQHI